MSKKPSDINGHNSKHKNKKNHGRKKLIRNIISVIYSFLLTVCLSIILLAVALRFGFFDKGMTLNKINESDYYNSVYAELMDNLDTIVDSKGVNKSVLTDVITDKRVYINGKQFIENSLNNEDTKVEVDNIDKELLAAMETYYKEHNIKIDSNIKADMDATISAINSEYIRMIRFQFVDYIRQYKNDIYSVFKWLLPLVSVIGVILIILLILVHKYPHRGVRFIGLSFVSSGLLCMLMPLYLLVEKTYQNISTGPKYYIQFLQEYVQWSLSSFVYTGALAIMISIILFVVMQMMKNRIR